MKKCTVLAATVALLAVALSGSADAQGRECLFDGEVYEDGDRVGPYVCENGEWILPN
ncbi:hypothetical protein [Ruegeria atlantica]|uniref:hypothetical protein n=1 Tax=Ruegeria atlantica TaxID=81569 RepID=UPI00147E2C74|nr:hypothetical protein [Ruegeria atlantica]